MQHHQLQALQLTIHVCRVTYVCSGIASSTSFGKADLEIEHQCIVEFKAKNIALKDVLPQLNKYVRTKKYMRDKNITGGIVVAEEVAKYRQDVPKGTHLVGDIWGIIINFFQRRSEIHFWVPGYTRDTMILPVQFGEYLTLEQVSAIVRPMLRPMTVPFVPQPTVESVKANQTILSTFFTRRTADDAATLNLNVMDDGGETSVEHRVKRAPMLPLHIQKRIDADASTTNAETCDKRGPMSPEHHRKCM